jgi:hypothetical protein
MKDPGGFVRFRRQRNRGSTPDFIFGFRRGGGSEIQAYRYPIGRFARAAAAAHCRGKGGRFEAAAANAGDGEMRAATIRANIALPQVRTEQLDGRSYDVYSVVLLVEGVHSGSAGPYFYPSQVLSENPAIWNGAPLTVQHPENFLGDAVSANQPFEFERSVGWLFNVRWEPRRNRLIGEAWIDREKTERVAPELFAELQANGQVEVSTGLWFENDGTAGTWQGEEFHGSITGIQRDHLALLPGQVGACSLADGCGLGVNEQGETMDQEKMIRLIMANVLGQREIHGKLQRALDALDDQSLGVMHYLEEVYDGEVVFFVDTRNAARRYFRTTYTVDQNSGAVTLGTQRQEVRKDLNFVPVRMAQAAGTDNASDDCGCDDHGDDAMSKKEDLVAALIANDGTPFTEACKENLMAFSEEVLGKMAPPEGNADGGDGEEKPPDDKPEETPETPPAEPVQPPAATPTPPPPAPVAQARPLTPEQWIEKIPVESVRNWARKGLAAERTLRAQKVTAITNAVESLKPEDLEKTTDEELDRLIATVNALTPQADYTGAAGGLHIVDEDVPEDPPDPYANIRPKQA